MFLASLCLSLSLFVLMVFGLLLAHRLLAFWLILSVHLAVYSISPLSLEIPSNPLSLLESTYSVCPSVSLSLSI